MSSAQIPENLVLVDCSNDMEMRGYCHSQNSATWKSDLLTVDEYVQREFALSTADLCIQHLKTSENSDDVDTGKEESKGIFRKYLGVRYFALKDMSLPETSNYSQIVSSVETLNKVGYVVPPESGKQVPVLSVCIGGVFTAEKFRGNGYAKSMIQLLNKHYDDMAKTQEGVKTGKFLEWKVMTLYSEVGEFYSKVEYVSDHVPVHHINKYNELLKAIEQKEGKNTKNKSVKYMNFKGYDELVDLEIKETEEKIAKAVEKRNAKKGTDFIFVLKPDILIYQWFAVRDIYIGCIAFPQLMAKNPLTYGVSVNNMSTKTNAHCMWHHAWAEKNLTILKVFTQRQDDIFELFKYMILEAQKYNLKEIHIWDEELSKEKYPNFFATLESVVGADHLSMKNTSLSAIRAPFHGKVEWLNNGKFCWF